MRSNLGYRRASRRRGRLRQSRAASILARVRQEGPAVIEGEGCLAVDVRAP